jgi:hypothetical protein
MHLRIVGAGVGLTLFLAGSAAAPPAIAGQGGVPPIFVDGRIVHDRAILEHGHLLVPVRGVFEAFRAEVTYTPPRIVVVRKEGSVVAGLVVGGRHAVVYNRRGGRIYVPLRFIAEISSATVTYSRAPRLVDIRLPDRELKALPPAVDEAGVLHSAAPPTWALALIGACVVAFGAECLLRGIRLIWGRRKRGSP